VERLEGIGVSGGVAVGPALLAILSKQVVRFSLATEAVQSEVEALNRARAMSRAQIAQIRAELARRTSPELAAVFDAQLLLLDDPMLRGRAEAIVRSEQVNAEWAIQMALDETVAVFDKVDDPYLRERQGDLRDVVGRLQMNLRDARGAPGNRLKGLTRPCVLIADEVSPSTLAGLDWTHILGFATDAGSQTSHTAIFARSLGVPAVVGLHDASVRVPTGAWVIVDGATGAVTIDPSATEREAASRRRSSRARPPTPLAGPTRTTDGVAIRLLANIERSDDVSVAVAAGADGIGLYRSEFLLGGTPPALPDENEQYATYRRIVQAMAPSSVTIRTFDIDARQLGEAFPESMLDERPSSGRGQAGLRGIRYGLSDPASFKTQLRALLRAAAHGNLRIMFPFVSSVNEVREARILLAEARREVEAAHGPVPPVPVGVMIEVPSAALTASLIAGEADFFTVGTNDLIQYTLAVDRTDYRVSDRYEPMHPAVLDLLRQVRRAAARCHLPVSVCGEMASDPLLLQVLVGCGITEFSMTPGSIPLAGRVLAQTDASRMVRLVSRLRVQGTREALQRCLEALVDPDRSSKVNT